MADLLSSALPPANNRFYGKESGNLNDANDGRIDLLLDNSPRSILDNPSTSSATGKLPGFYIYYCFIPNFIFFVSRLIW